MELQRHRRDPEVGELASPGIRLEQPSCVLTVTELRVEPGVGLLEQLDCLIDERITHGSDCDEYV
jgi:hypothetical protein